MSNEVTRTRAPGHGPQADTETRNGTGLIMARRRIAAARERGVTPSDGGSTGRTDGND
jgi:hypothetical protein